MIRLEAVYDLVERSRLMEGGEDGNAPEENSSILSQERPGSDVSVIPVNQLRNKLDSFWEYLGV
jgi:hypothetical protein